MQCVFVPVGWSTSGQLVLCPVCSLFYMPTAADSLVGAARDWLESEGGGGPFGSLRDSASPAAAAAATALFAPAKEGRRQMLDRYSQHTAHCKPCRCGRACKPGAPCAQTIRSMRHAACAWSPPEQQRHVCDTGGLGALGPVYFLERIVDAINAIHAVRSRHVHIPKWRCAASCPHWRACILNCL
jgi:hypothetical protein